MHKIKKVLLTNYSYKYYGHERYVLSFGENVLIGRGIGERGQVPFLFLFTLFSLFLSPSPFCTVCHAGYPENAYSALSTRIHG